MDQNTTSLLILVIVSVVTSMCTSVLQFTLIFMKLIKRSTCCGATLEMKTSVSADKLSPVDNKNLDIILDRLSITK